MKLGLFGINMGPSATPDELIATAQAAEAAGLRVAVGGGARRAARPAGAAVADGAAGPALDPLLALTWAAAHTSTLRLATGIIILPQRNPVVLAKEIASLDVLSGGRFTLGIGVGYLEPEFRAIGADFEHRGAVTDEYLDAMQHLWYDEHPEFHGRFADFAGVDAYPRPVQRPIPIVVGGHTPPRVPSRRRTGHGWYGFAMTPELRWSASPRCGPPGPSRAASRSRPARDHRDAAAPPDRGGSAGVRRARRRPHRRRSARPPTPSTRRSMPRSRPSPVF